MITRVVTPGQFYVRFLAMVRDLEEGAIGEERGCGQLAGLIEHVTEWWSGNRWAISVEVRRSVGRVPYPHNWPWLCSVTAHDSGRSALRPCWDPLCELPVGGLR